MKKTWFKSKAIWGGVAVFLGGGLTAIGHAELGAGLVTFGLGLGFIGIRKALK